MSEALAAARQRVEALLVEELGSNTALRRAVTRRFDQLVDPSPEMKAASEAMARLLGGLARKTSPLHLRLAHALGRFYLEQPADGAGAELVVMIDEVCDMIRRPDLKSESRVSVS